MKKIDNDITEDAFRRIKEMVGQEEEEDPEAPADPVKGVNLVFSTEERFAIYEGVLEMLKAGEDHREIARNVVSFLNERISERMKKANQKTRKSPIFRRVG